MMSVTGDAATARRCAAAIPSPIRSAGMTAAFAIASALVRRRRPGEGAFIDVSMLDSALDGDGLGHLQLPDRRGRAACRTGNDNFTAAPSGAFRAQDGSDQHRRQQAGAVRGAGARPRPRRPGARPALCLARGPQGSIGRADARARKVAPDAQPAPSGNRCSTRSASRPVACSRCRRRWRCRRWRSAACLKTFDDVPGIDRPLTIARTGFRLSDGDPDVGSPPPVLGAHTDEVLARRRLQRRRDRAAAREGRRYEREEREPEERRGKACRRERMVVDRIIDIEPGKIAIRGYPIQELIGRLGFARDGLAHASRRDPDAGPGPAARGRAGGGGRPRAARACRSRSRGWPSPAACRSTARWPRRSTRSTTSTAVPVSSAWSCSPRSTPPPASATPSERRRVAAVLERYQSEHGKIVPGFGHRWHGVDSRARSGCCSWSPRPRQGGVVAGRFARHAKTVERLLEAQKRSPIPMNIDGATAVLYSELGFAPALGRGIFILLTLGRHPRPRLGADRAGRTDQGADVARHSYRYTGPRHGPSIPSEARPHEAAHLAPARQVPRRSRRRIPVRSLRPHQHRGARRAAKSSTIKFVNTRHEQIAAHIADGYARAKHTTAVVLSHLGPGLTNASTGVANAALDSIPMVVIAGDIPSHYYGKHPHQEVNLHADASQSEIYRPFVKRVWRVERPDLFPEIIDKAFQLAESGRPGPVLVVGADGHLLDGSRDLAVRAPRQPHHVRCTSRRWTSRPARRSSAPLLEAQVAADLRRRRQSLLADAAEELRELAEPPGDPGRAHADGQGRAARRPSADARHDRLLGNRSSSTTSASPPTGSSASARASPKPTAARGRPSSRSACRRSKLIHIDIDPNEIGRNFPVEIGVVTDLKEALVVLNRVAQQAGAGARTQRQAGRRDRELSHQTSSPATAST